MAKRYMNAPLTEALFDIQVELPKEVTVAMIENLSGALLEKYPTKKPRRKFSAKFEFNSDTLPTTESSDLGIDGFFFWSKDEKQVAQFRLDGFSFSRLKPYTSWEETFPEMCYLWECYRDHLNPLNIKRIAVRYINLIEIPKAQEGIDWTTYFTMASFNSGDIAYQIDAFMHRTSFQLPNKSIKGMITFLTGPIQDPSKVSVIFDLDVFMEVQIHPSQFAVENLFGSLRDVKDQLFESCLTETMKDQFK